MKKALILAIAAAACAPSVMALHDDSLQQKNAFLPRDQYLNLTDPEKVNTKHVVLQFIEDTRVRLVDGRLVSLEGLNLGKMAAFLERHPEIRLRRNITSLTVEEVDAWVERGERLSGIDLVDMNNYYTLEIHGDNPDPKGLLQELLSDPMVETVYYHPIVRLATCNADIAPATPNYTANQDYLDPAPDGVDMDYAWNFNTYGNGTASNWVMDIENDWCSNHEDMNTDFGTNIYNWDGSNDDADGDHGTAVMGIVGACNNGFGITGMVSDNTMRGWSWSGNGDPYPDVSNSIAGVGAPLITGDTYLIEIHAPGPSQGTTCTCNCDQFEYIAMEYWAANFNAIAANSANGLYCVEASGNGSMNLDSGVYGGAFNRAVRDSDAVLVGAATDDATHDPTCWTSHGTRIDVYGWGQNVESLGYGDRFDGVGGSCRQEYTSTFSGTSSATPIVAGTVASLALIHRYGDAGSWLSPEGLRSRLQVNGTPQATDFSREIGVMPNMKGILAPDLEPFPAGWDAAIVAKISDAAPDGEIPATALDPAPTQSYVDWKWINSSYYSSAAPARASYYRDDVSVIMGTMGNLGPSSYTFVCNYPNAVRGGRHVLSVRCDNQFELDEGDETDNISYESYVWEGTPIAEDTPTYFTQGPKYNPAGYSFFSCDGFYDNGNFGFWEVWAVCATAGNANYDLRLHAEVPTATTGFGANVAYSSLVGQIDFVGTNANGGSDADRVGVLNPDDSNSGYRIESDGSQYLGLPPATPALEIAGNLDTDELVDVYELNLTAGTPVQIILSICSGDADLGLFLFGPSQEYFRRSGAQATANSNGQEQGEEIVFTPTESGYHCLVVSKNALEDLYRSASYDLIYGQGTIGDLTHSVYSTWDDDIVVRNAGGTTGDEPTTIAEGSVVVDAGYRNISSSGIFGAGSNTAFSLDGNTVYTTANFIPFNPLQVSFTPSNPLGTVPGGRHQIGVHLDSNNEVVEISELGCLPDNNHAWERYVVAPYTLTSNLPLTRTAAPNHVDTRAPAMPTSNFMQHGYAVDPNGWSFTACTVENGAAGEGLNIHAYDYHATDVATPLLDPVSNSIGGDNQVVYVGVNGLTVAGTRDIGINNHQSWQAEPSTSSYRVHFADQAGTLLHGTINGPYTMPAGELVDSYRVYLNAGSTYDILFDIMSGNADLGVAVYGPGLSYTQMTDAELVLNSSGGGLDESGSLTATSTGFHGVAVYKTATADLDLAATYRIRLNAPAQPMPVSDLRIIPDEVDDSDGTFHFHYTWSPVTQDVNGVPLVVDHYDFYWSLDPYAPFPADWVFHASYPSSPTPSIPHADVPQLGVRFVAVDSDGFLVGDSGDPLAPRLPAGSLREQARTANSSVIGVEAPRTR